MAGDEFDWVAWRREARRSLIDARRGLAETDRRARNAAIDAHLRDGFAALGGLSVGFCWPFGGEPEPRFAVRRWREAGSRAALPVVIAARSPLEFREWWPGVSMVPGVYGIPHPADTAAVLPAAAVVPVNGFDAAGYRLGYGGGYFDRTLAALPHRPVTVGLGYEIARIRTIHPRPHDVAFDFMVTEAGIGARTDRGLEAVAPAEADRRVRAIVAERGLG